MNCNDKYIGFIHRVRSKAQLKFLETVGKFGLVNFHVRKPFDPRSRKVEVMIYNPHYKG